MFSSKRALNALRSSSRCSGDNSFLNAVIDGLLIIMVFILSLKIVYAGFTYIAAVIAVSMVPAFFIQEPRHLAEIPTI